MYEFYKLLDKMIIEKRRMSKTNQAFYDRQIDNFLAEVQIALKG
jgi:hypothetical protein